MVAKMVIMEYRLFVMDKKLLHCTFIVGLLCTATVVLNVNVLNWKDIPVVTGTSILNRRSTTVCTTGTAYLVFIEIYNTCYE